MKIIHCADLHLAEQDKEYAFSVLNEIVDITNKHKADMLIFAGDTFNSFSDVEKLRSDFRKTISLLSSECRVMLLPGNHDLLGSNKRNLVHFDFGDAEVLAEEPFGLKQYKDIEILSIPHQENYNRYTEWSVPPKSLQYRIAIAHSTIADMSFAGIDEEENTSIMDSDIFSRFNVDYAAMGHIHSSRKAKSGVCLIVYPGSARVWRGSQYEAGQKKIILLEINNAIETKELILIKAGQYREYTWPLTLKGNLPDISRDTELWGEYDFINIELRGIVDDENPIKNIIKNIKNEWGSPKTRKINIIKDDVDVFPGISSHPIAKKFLEIWEKKKDLFAEEVWFKAREEGLFLIKEQLGKNID